MCENALVVTPNVANGFAGFAPEVNFTDVFNVQICTVYIFLLRCREMLTRNRMMPSKNLDLRVFRFLDSEANLELNRQACWVAMLAVGNGSVGVAPEVNLLHEVHAQAFLLYFCVGGGG